MKKIIVILCLILLAEFALAGTSKQPLPEDQAFLLSANLFGKDTILVNWQIADKHYLYRDRINFKLLQPNNAQIGSILLPDGEWKQDQIFGKYQVFKDNVTIPVPIINPNPQATILQINYQGCSEDGYCYPPTTRIANVNFAAGAVNFATTTISSTINPTTTPDKFSNLLLQRHLITIFFMFIGFGLLLSFTPCILPMIPIISGIIVGQGTKLTAGKAFRLSLVYVISMAATYAVAGILIGYLGSNIQAVMQKPWVLILFSLLFVVIALSYFDLYQIRLPARFEERIAKISRHQQGGHYLSVIIMGCLASLIVSPCVTPALVGVLGYVAKTGDALLGGIALFALGFGMGLPLIIICTAGGKLLPKSGAWMNTVKSVFGVLFIAVAIWILARIIPGEISMLLWSILLIVSAIFMGSLSMSPKNNWGKLWQGIGIIILVYGVLLLIGAAMGNTNPLKPLAFNHTSAQTNNSQVQFTRIKNITDLTKILAQAKNNHQPVMLDFYADWCLACKEMEYSTFADTKVITALSSYVRLQADVTANNEDDKKLMQTFNVIAPPTIIFFNKQGQPLMNQIIIGKMDANEFLQHLQGLS